jgi:probable F420-dependent oxidoreductase
MRFSIWPSPEHPWADLREIVTHADRTGWHGAYVADHFMPNAGGQSPPQTPVLEATAVLAALAGITTNLRLAPLVLGGGYRHPAVLANWAATIDHVSGGRFLLGVGAGWQENEHEQYGIELPPPGQRLARFEELCTVLRSLLHEPRTTFDGAYFQLHDALCEPKPVQQPMPLLVGGKGDRMLGVVARHADEWNMWSLPDLLSERLDVLRRHCDAIGRDPAEIAVSTQPLVLLTDDAGQARRFVDAVAPRPAFAGTPAQLAELAERFSAIGVAELIVPDWVLGRSTEARLDNLDRLIDAFAPLCDA